MTTPRVKICGITSVADAQLAAAAGADAIGLVFYEPSPRNVSLEQARAIARAAGPFVTVVGLFVNAEQDFIDQVLSQVDLHVLQFHGDESPAECERYRRPYMKALRMKAGLDIEQAMAAYPSASAILLDAYKPGVPGGTGDSFDWARVPKNCGQPIVVAGGLNPDNVSAALAATAAYGMDVSGGVEASPGCKDADKVKNFIRRAKGWA